MTDRPNVLFFDFAAELAENFDTDVTGSVYSVEICVKECPTGIVSHDDLYQGMGQALYHITYMDHIIWYIRYKTNGSYSIRFYPLNRISKRK